MPPKRCDIKERKPLMPLKTLDIIFRRRHLPNTQFYYTNRQHAVDDTTAAGKPLSKVSSPFSVPKSQKLLSYIKYSDRKEKVLEHQRLNLPLAMKDNAKMAAIRDLSKRLFIEEPPNDIRTVLEIHPEFYAVIEGRPIRTFDDIKVYMSNIRTYAMLRQQIGYRKDLIIKIDRNKIDEENEYDTVTNNLKQTIRNFQRFLTEDYKNACAEVAKAEAVFVDLQTKTVEFLNYISKITLYNNILFKLDAVRNTLKIYRRYLFFVAPLSWRQQFDETLIGRVQSIQFDTGQFATENDLVDSLDVDKMIESAIVELKNPLPNHLYFTSPNQMMYIFRTMELQSREYLMQLSKTVIPYLQLQEHIKQLKQVAKKELEYFRYYIDALHYAIEQEVFNEQYLQEKFFRILKGSFYDSVAKRSTLKLKLCIEYVYEQIFGKCDEGHTNLYDPMKILEVLFEEYNLRLDSLDFKIVNKARNDFFQQDLIMMRNAYRAQRELRTFREMTNAMNKAFLPPAKFKRPLMEKFVDRKKREARMAKEKSYAKALLSSTTVNRRQKKYKLTAEEREGLIMFTEYCDGMDPAPYLEQYYTYAKPVLDREPKLSL